jgi:hypothetical protein
MLVVAEGSIDGEEGSGVGRMDIGEREGRIVCAVD